MNFSKTQPCVYCWRVHKNPACVQFCMRKLKESEETFHGLRCLYCSKKVRNVYCDFHCQKMFILRQQTFASRRINGSERVNLVRGQFNRSRPKSFFVPGRKRKSAIFRKQHSKL